VAVDREIVGALDLEKLTGTKASTWRYWASIGTGPASFKLGRRRVWKKSIVLEWLAEQEATTVRDGLEERRTTVPTSTRLPVTPSRTSDSSTMIAPRT
jgi:prophage regulatory protein